MGWRPPEANLDGAAMGVAEGKPNIHLLQALQQIRAELKLHRQKLGQEALSLSQHSSEAPAPALAGVTVRLAAKGHFQLLIKSPEFVNPRGPTANQQKTPLYHEVEYATTPTFSDAVVLAPSHQTFFPIAVEPGARLFVKVRSSQDGVNWNKRQIVRSQ